jgi:hypothetical protein
MRTIAASALAAVVPAGKGRLGPRLCSGNHAGPGIRDEEPMPERRPRFRLGEMTAMRQG